MLTQIRSPGQSVERQKTRHRHRADTSKLDYAIHNNTDWASVKPSLACRTYSNLEVHPWLIWKEPFQETLEFRSVYVFIGYTLSGCQRSWAFPGHGETTE